VSRLLRLAMTAAGEVLRAAAPAIRSVKITRTPPDQPAEYPAIALMPEGRFKIDTHGDIEVLDASDDPVIIDGSRAVMEVGTLSGTVLLWLSARLEGQRETIADDLIAAFCGDDLANGRLLVELPNVEVSGHATGAAWPFAFFLDDSEWRDEMVFSERRWIFMRLAVDVPILVLRENAALVTTMIAALTSDLTTVIDDPTDVAVPPLGDLQQVLVNDDGSVGATYP